MPFRAPRLRELTQPGSPYAPGQCRLCWLYYHDAAYRALWGGTGEAPGHPPGRPPRTAFCLHLGPVIDRKGCNCPLLHVRRCDVHTTCTLALCQTCPDYESDDPAASFAAWYFSGSTPGRSMLTPTGTIS